MVGDGVLEEVEPEERELGEDASLVGDAGGEDVIEGGDAVGGDEEEVGGGVRAEGIDVADLAAGEQRQRCRDQFGERAGFIGLTVSFQAGGASARLVEFDDHMSVHLPVVWPGSCGADHAKVMAVR